MKLIEQKAELLIQQDWKKQIEIAARTCYKSEPSIKDGSAKDMVEKLIKMKHCYTGDCEVLTRNGWVKWKYYNNEDLAVVSPDLYFLGFESPSHVIRKKYKGKFYEFPAMGIKVTDGHRMFGVFRESKNDFYNSSSYNFFRCDQEYKDNNGRLKTLGERMFKSPRCCSAPIGFDAFHELVGFWLGDGCHSSYKDKLVFHLKKERKINYLRHLCEELELKLEEGANNHYRVIAPTIGTSFNNQFYKDECKYIDTNSFRNAIQNYSIILGLLNSDGSKGINTSTITYTTTSKYIKNWLEVIAPTVGFHISIHNIPSKNINQKDLYKVLFQTTKYTLNNDSRKPDTKCIISEEELDVYCATVSTGLLLVRGNNGVVSVCGNCSMLEHGTIYLHISVGDTGRTNKLSRFFNKYYNNPYSRAKMDYTASNVYITTNYRVIKEHGWEKDLKYMCNPTDNHIKRYTFRLTTSIGIVRELLRHRVFSFANESTRYCNYSKDKFDNGITCIMPSWFLDENIQEAVSEYFMDACKDAENYYFSLLKCGYSPQAAREVLPLCTKSELIMTGFEDDWENFLDIRLRGTTGKPHPDMVELAQLIEDELCKVNKVIKVKTTHEPPFDATTKYNNEFPSLKDALDKQKKTACKYLDEYGLEVNTEV